MQFQLQKGSLQRNVFFMLLGNGLFAFSQWFQISLIAKYSSIDTLGYFTLTLSIISPIFMFTGLQLRTLIITDVDSKIKFNTFFTLRIITSFISLFLIVVIGFFIANKSLFPFLILLSFQKLLEGISELFNSKHQQHERVEFLAQSLLLKGLAIVLSIWLGLVIVKSLFIGLLLILVFYLFIIYFNDYRNYKNIYHEKVVFEGQKKVLYDIMILGLPLGIVLLIISLNANVSKYFLEIYSGTEKQAIFSAISYILVIGLFILDSLGQSFVPRLSRYFYERKFKNFKNLTLSFVGLSLLIGTTLFVFSLFFGKVGLQLLFNEKISEYSGFLSQYLLVCILVFVASSLGYTLTSMGEFKVQPFINLVILLMNLVLSFFLIKKYELFGVITVLGICFLLQIIITTYLILRKISKIKKTDLL